MIDFVGIDGGACMLSDISDSYKHLSELVDSGSNVLIRKVRQVAMTKFFVSKIAQIMLSRPNTTICFYTGRDVRFMKNIISMFKHWFEINAISKSSYLIGDGSSGGYAGVRVDSGSLLVFTTHGVTMGSVDDSFDIGVYELRNADDIQVLMSSKSVCKQNIVSYFRTNDEKHVLGGGYRLESITEYQSSISLLRDVHGFDVVDFDWTVINGRDESWVSSEIACLGRAVFCSQFILPPLK